MNCTRLVDFLFFLSLFLLTFLEPCITLSTQKTALSQTHLDGSRNKKSLSERVHHDVTGIKMDRDLFSAYLSRHVNQDDTLLWQDAASQYSGSESILSDAWQQSKNRKQVGDAERGLIAPERLSEKLKNVD